MLTLSPPLTLRADWFAQHLPYTLSKYGMSMVSFGMAEEFKPEIGMVEYSSRSDSPPRKLHQAC